MRAATLHGPRELSVETRPPIVPGGDQVVVAVRAVGLCGTDYRIWTGDRPVSYPRIMGHEFFGHVLAAGPEVRGLTAGQRVGVEPNYSCGQCPLCREGNRHLCLLRTAIGIDVDGGFAEQVAVPARCCWPAPEAPEHQLLLTEPLAVVVRAVKRGAPVAGEWAAVLGVGTLGLLAVQVLTAAGMRVLAVSRSERRLGLAQRLGAEAVARTPESSDAARAVSGREGVSLVIETAGTAEAVRHAVDLCRPGGRIVLTGLPHAPTPLEFLWVVRRELSIVGSMIYQDEFPEAMRLLAAGTVRAEPLITHRFPLERIQDAFEAHESPDAIKVAVDV